MPSELLDGPFEGVVLRDVDCTASGSVETGTLHIFWHWDKDIHVVGNALFLIVALHLDHEADAGVRGGLHNHINREQRLDSNVETVAHELELSVGGNESDQALVLEPAQPDALMEFDIVELHRLVLGGAALRLVVSLIVEAQFQVRHARELAIRIDHSDDLALDDVVGGADEHRQFLYYIEEELIF